jgi:hypothetical protein
MPSSFCNMPAMGLPRSLVVVVLLLLLLLVVLRLLGAVMVAALLEDTVSLVPPVTLVSLVWLWLDVACAGDESCPPPPSVHKPILVKLVGLESLRNSIDKRVRISTSCPCHNVPAQSHSLPERVYVRASIHMQTYVPLELFQMKQEFFVSFAPVIGIQVGEFLHGLIELFRCGLRIVQHGAHF